MRLIDADALAGKFDYEGWVESAIAVEGEPTIDAVPVVRCKYCVHRGIDYYGRITCRRICVSRNECGIHLPSKNFYCAAGEVGLVFRNGKWVWSNSEEGMFHAVD